MFESLMSKLFSKNEKSSRDIARDRLKVVLIQDRANLAPDVMENLRDDIIRVISNYMEINKNDMELSLENEANSVALVANIPVSRMKHGMGR